MFVNRLVLKVFKHLNLKRKRLYDHQLRATMIPVNLKKRFSIFLLALLALTASVGLSQTPDAKSNHPVPARNTGTAFNSTSSFPAEAVQTDQLIVPYGTRFDRPGLTFPNLRQFGIHQNSGGGWFSINANNIALGAQSGTVGLLRDSQLAWGLSVETPIDCPPCQYGGIGMPAPGVLGITSANEMNALVLGGTWRATPNTPPQITAQMNNYNPGAPSYFQRWSTDTARQVTGLTFATPQVSGQVHQIWNVGTEDIVLVYESGNSFAANRFRTTSGTNLILTPDQCATVIYDGISRRWRAHLCH